VLPGSTLALDNSALAAFSSAASKATGVGGGVGAGGVCASATGVQRSEAAATHARTLRGIRSTGSAGKQRICSLLCRAMGQVADGLNGEGVASLFPAKQARGV